MFKLSIMQNYLQQILNESNTIIIPGFGALTITSTKTGDIYFMPFLKHDDGLLAKHIANVETIELDDAKNTITNFVNTVNSSLDNGENFEMTEFGRFKINSEGEIEFQRWEEYQIKDNTILSKKVKERKNSKEKMKTTVSENESLNQPYQNEVFNTLEEPVKTDKEIHQQIEEELPISTNPFHLSLEETDIHPIEETNSDATITEQKSIDVLVYQTENQDLSLESTQNNENEIIHNEFVTFIEEENEESTTFSSNLHDIHTSDERDVEKDIVSHSEPIVENTMETIIETKEDKKALRKKRKNEKAIAKATQRRLKKSITLDNDNLENQAPKEKKKSRSMIFWLFSAILLTVGTMWFIKKQRDNKVHLTVIDKKESKIITNKVIEKKELHKELSKHTTKKVEEKESSPHSTKDISNETTSKNTFVTTPKIENQNTNVASDAKSVSAPKSNTKLNVTPTVKTENTSALNTKNTTTTPPAKINSVIISSTPIIAPVPAPKKIITPNPNPAYTSPNKNIQVIVGTFKDKASADQLLSNLKTDGFNTAFSKELNGSYQVSLGSFTTLSESNTALQKYRGVK